MSNAGRLARKKERIEKNEAERKFDELIGLAKKERDEQLFKINTAHTKALQELEETRLKARKEAWEAYDAKRDAALKAVA